MYTTGSARSASLLKSAAVVGRIGAHGAITDARHGAPCRATLLFTPCRRHVLAELRHADDHRAGQGGGPPLRHALALPDRPAPQRGPQAGPGSSRHTHTHTCAHLQPSGARLVTASAPSVLGTQPSAAARRGLHLSTVPPAAASLPCRRRRRRRRRRRHHPRCFRPRLCPHFRLCRLCPAAVEAVTAAAEGHKRHFRL